MRERAAFVCSDVFNGVKPVLLVALSDGDWMFMCGAAHGEDEGFQVVGIAHLVERDPTLSELKDLKEGTQAERTAMSEPWQRNVFQP